MDKAESADHIIMHHPGMKHHGFVPGLFFFRQATQPENVWTELK